jgi:pantothenate kinase
MEKVYKELADELIAKLNTRSRLLVGIAGVPGSGKSTAAKEISRIINQKNSNMAVVVPMDGFHFYRSELDAMPDPKEAHDRRGAPFTFNAEKFHRLLQQIKETGAAKAPSFDHRFVRLYKHIFSIDNESNQLNAALKIRKRMTSK